MTSICKPPGHQVQVGLLRMSYLFDLSNLENTRVKNITRFFADTYENSRRWHWRGLPWAPGAPKAVADVIFDFSNLENLPSEEY